jgi:hypothetical protein
MAATMLSPLAELSAAGIFLASASIFCHDGVGVSVNFAADPTTFKLKSTRKAISFAPSGTAGSESTSNNRDNS